MCICLKGVNIEVCEKDEGNGLRNVQLKYSNIQLEKVVNMHLFKGS